MIKKLLLILAVLLGLILIIAYFLPRDFSLSKSVTIDAPRENVYDYVRFLKNQEKYSVWVMADPKVKMTYTGTDGTVGAISAWVSEDSNVGVGEQEIKMLVPNEKMTVEIRFEKPMKAMNYADTTLETVDGKTKVTSTFYGNNPFPFNIMCLFIDKLVGGDMQKNLENLKKNLETNTENTVSTPPTNEDEIKVQNTTSITPEEAKQKLVGTWQDQEDPSHTLTLNSNGTSQDGQIKGTWTVFTKNTIPKIISSVWPSSLQDNIAYLVMVPNKEYDIGVEGFYSIQQISDTTLELVVEPSDVRGGIVTMTKIK